MTPGKARTQTTDITPLPPGDSYMKEWLDPQSSEVTTHMATPPPLSWKIICTSNPSTKKKVILRPASEPYLGS